MTLILVDERRFDFFFERGYSITLLKRRWAVLQVHEMFEFGLLTAQVHERDGWLDGL